MHNRESLQQGSAKELIDASSSAEKPDKENAMNASYGFPKYIGSKIIINLQPSKRSSVEFLSAAPSRSKSYRISPEDITFDTRTTCMIKNIPNKLTSDMLVNFINETHFGTYAFLYLRMDFKNKCNVGYAFIDFIDTSYIRTFYERINGKGWKNFSSGKIAELTYASIQGLDCLKRKFKNSHVMLEHKSFRPKVFFIEGPLKGLEKPTFD